MTYVSQGGETHFSGVVLEEIVDSRIDVRRYLVAIMEPLDDFAAEDAVRIWAI